MKINDVYIFCHFIKEKLLNLDNHFKQIDFYVYHVYTTVYFTFVQYKFLSESIKLSFPHVCVLDFSTWKSTSLLKGQLFQQHGMLATSGGSPHVKSIKLGFLESQQCVSSSTYPQQLQNFYIEIQQHGESYIVQLEDLFLSCNFIRSVLFFFFEVYYFYLNSMSLWSGLDGS